MGPYRLLTLSGIGAPSSTALKSDADFCRSVRVAFRDQPDEVWVWERAGANNG